MRETASLLCCKDDRDDHPPFRVLCVDDNCDAADSTAALLRVVGFEAMACYDGIAALRIAEEFQPSVCLLDLNMPGLAGDALATKLLAGPDWKPLLVVAITAMSNDESCRRIEAAGFHLHLVKPVDPQKLIALMDCLFQRATSIRGNVENSEV